jgi:hypothetical protein
MGASSVYPYVPSITESSAGLRGIAAARWLPYYFGEE